MRVIAGTFGGRRLSAVPARGVRPTSDRVREAVFSVLGDAVVDARVLDLYAGTGAMAIEAVSRGARHAVCVERGRAARRTIEANVATLEIGDRVRVVAADALDWARGRAVAEGPFDLVFCDPPYAAGPEPIARVVLTTAWWTTACVLEHAAGTAPASAPPGIALDTRGYGDTAVTFAWREAGDG